MIAPSDLAARNAASTSSQKSPDARNVSVCGNEINSRELFANDREIVIAHGDDRYRLRLTSQNKLILTK